MKTIKVELPDTVMCAFVNYVYIDEVKGLAMGTRSIDSEDIEKGYSEHPRKGGATV